MADNPPLDIFAADIDVNNFFTTSQVTSGSLPVKPKLTKAQKKLKNIIRVQNNWKKIESLGDTSSKKNKNQARTEHKKLQFVMNDRPNLTVVNNIKAAKSNTDNKKPAPAPEPTTVAKEMEKKAEAPPKAPQEPAPKPQTPAVQGRMTASSFMNVDKPSKTQPSYSYYRHNAMPNMYLNSYPKGIPKSFLTAEHQQQLGTNPQRASQAAGNNTHFSTPQTASPSNKEPVWEALPSKPPANQSQPNWPSSKRFDQLPTGQYSNQIDQQYSAQNYAQSSQGFGPSAGPTGQSYREQGSSTAYEQHPMFVETETKYEEVRQEYSPTDTYVDMGIHDALDELSDQSRDSHTSSKRQSAFQRLGPVTQPKKPKLTINLMVGKEQAVREVVKESKDPDEDKYAPVAERPDIQTSLDDTVMKYLTFWPWKKPMSNRRTLTVKESKAVMQLDLEQMEIDYEKDKSFFEILVTGYPKSWTKEDVLDTILEAVKGKSLIPCFIEFSRSHCKFLVIRSKPALVAIHKLGFTYRKDDVVLTMSIVVVNLSVNQIDFIPRLILRKRLSMSMEGENELCLKNFTLASDISHFLYFPLNRVANQAELMQLQSSVPWHTLTTLDLSHNRIESLSGFDLTVYVPKLKHLNLSHNQINSISTLLAIRELPLTTIFLEGNPLCLDYIEQERYIKALKLIFPALREIDGVKLTRPGEIPPFKRNYALPDSEQIASKLLETLFPLLDTDIEERQLCEDLYMDDAVMTVTFMHKLRYSKIYKDCFPLFARARVLDEGKRDKIEGAVEIAKTIHRWPKLEHDPLTFTVDVLYHTDTTTMLRISGVMKVTTESLAEEEHLLYFTRSLVLHSLDDREYKISNEMIYWDMPVEEVAMGAFRMTTGRSRTLSFKLDGPPEPDLRKNLLEMFMKLTELDRKRSENCLEMKKWHFKNALDYFVMLSRLDSLHVLENLIHE